MMVVEGKRRSTMALTAALADRCNSASNGLGRPACYVDPQPSIWAEGGVSPVPLLSVVERRQITRGTAHTCHPPPPPYI